MKITVSRLFEKASMGTDEVVQKISPLIEYMNLFADNAIRALRNGLTLTDNLDAEIKSISVKHNTESTLAVKGRPLAVIVAQQTPTTNPLDQFIWSQGTGNQINLTAKFDSAPTTAVTLTLWIQY